HEAGGDRVDADDEHDRHRRGRRSGRQRRRRALRHDHVYRTPNQLVRQRRKSIVLTVGPAELDRDILPLDEPDLAQAAAKQRQLAHHSLGSGKGAEEADHRHRRLLRARGERPRRRSAERPYQFATAHSIRDELALFWLLEWHPVPTSQVHGRISNWRRPLRGMASVSGREASAGMNAPTTLYSPFPWIDCAREAPECSTENKPPPGSLREAVLFDALLLHQAARVPNRCRFSRCFSLRGGSLNSRAAVPPRMLCFAFSDRNGRS